MMKNLLSATIPVVLIKQAIIFLIPDKISFAKIDL